MELETTAKQDCIFIIDDNPNNVKLLEKILLNLNYSVRVAIRGSSAIKSIQLDKPDLILLDLVMPDMDGYEVCEKLKNNQQTKNIPIIFISALDDTVAKVKALKAGGIDYISKPFRPEEVSARIQTHLSIRNMQKKLELQNIELQQEIIDRKKAETALKKAYDIIDERVKERTRELSESNINLLEEIELHNKAKNDLRESEEKYRILVEHAADAFFLFTLDGKILDVNQCACYSLGYTREDLISMSMTEVEVYVDVDAKRHEHKKKFWKQLAHTQPVTLEGVHRRKNGTTFPVEVRLGMLELSGNSLMVGLVRDITERKHAENKIKTSLKEKEVLLREIHHRVKNNMQVITTLLMLQSDKFKDKQLSDMFEESQNRIKSMALVHENLYKTGNFSNINVKDYVDSLTRNLFRSYGIDSNKITLILDVENVLLGLENAIPCGLIINELVSNSLKYAFPNNRDGKIRIALTSINTDELVLEVSDNGIGMSEKPDTVNKESVGLHLVTILSEDQLEGKVEHNGVNGTSFHIKFKKQIYKKRI